MPFPMSLDNLKKLLDSDYPMVLVVVGAGVSIGATGEKHASWSGLLEHGMNHLVNTKKITADWRKVLMNSLHDAFSPFNLALALQHAANIEVNLKTPDIQAFAEWLESAFRDFEPRAGETDTLEALRDLQQAGALLLTTNYDSLLSDFTGLSPVCWDNHSEFMKVMRRERNGILHIHGHWKQPNTVVLGQSSYDRVLRNTKFQDAFKSLWINWTWLYVGCDDFFLQQ